MPARLRKVLVRAALSIAALLGIGALAAALALSNLDHPWVKQRIATAAGQELDYQKLELRGLSGLHLEQLVILNPQPVRAAARELLSLESLDVSWSLFELPRVEEVTARGLTVALVFDESGASSLPPSSAPVEPQPGLSQQLVTLMRSARPLDGADVKDVAITVLRTADGKVNDRLSVSGLVLGVKAAADGPGWKLEANLGDDLEVIRNAAQASLKLALAAKLDASRAELKVELATSRQTFAPDVDLRELLNVRARARFEPEQQRVTVELEPSRLAGVANLEGALVLPDDGTVPPVLTRATVDAQLAPLLALAPAGTVPVTLEDGSLHIEAVEVALSAVPRFRALQLKALATKVRTADATVGNLQLDVVTDPESTPDALTAHATLELEALEAGTLRVPAGRVELQVRRLAAAPASPLRVAGDVALSAALQSLVTESGKLRVAGEKLGLELTAALPQRPPFAVKADLRVDLLRVSEASGKRLLSAPARLQVDLSQATLALDGRAQVVFDAGKARATLDATRAGEELSYTYGLVAPELGIVTPFLSAQTASRAPWSQLSAKVDSTGRVAKLGSESPQVEHRTSLMMPRVEWDKIAARDVAFSLHSKGDALQHEGEAELRMQQLRAGEKELGAQHVTATAAVNRRKLDLSASLMTRTGPKLSLSTTLAWDGARRAVKCNVKAALQGAGPLLAALDVVPSLDKQNLETSLSLDGALLGVVEGVTSAGELQLVKAPQETAGFEGNAALDVAGLRWQGEGQTVSAPSLKWRAQMHTDGLRRTVKSTLELERLELVAGESRTLATNVEQELNASFQGAFERGALSVTQTLKAATVERRPALRVPVKNVSFSFTAKGEPGGLIQVSQAELANPASSTQLALSGTLDLSHKRRQLSVRGTLKQDLGALKRAELLEVRGGLDLAFQLSSPDLDVFRMRSKLKLSGVDLRLPDSDLDVQGMEGEVAINESVRFGKDGLELTREIDTNPYSMLRYADQHPLLSQNSFITAQRINTVYGVVTPFAANLTIDQNVVSLSQLELGLRGGWVTGQCTLELQGKASTLEVHWRATGVQSSRGEPFDGNAALVISAHERSVNGRVEILRIGTQHMREMLDILDPQHVDAAYNRIRTGLTVGYPERLRMVFDHGFLSMRISFGGAARLFKVEDVRGIPVGPLVNRWLASLWPKE